MLLMVNKTFQKVCGKLVFVSFLWIYWKDFGKCTLVWKMCGIICAKFQKTLNKKKKIEKVKIERLICANATHSIFGGNIWNMTFFKNKTEICWNTFKHNAEQLNISLELDCCNHSTVVNDWHFEMFPLLTDINGKFYKSKKELMCTYLELSWPMQFILPIKNVTQCEHFWRHHFPLRLIIVI